MLTNFTKDGVNFQKVTGTDDFLPSLQMGSVQGMIWRAQFWKVYIPMNIFEGTFCFNFKAFIL